MPIQHYGFHFGMATPSFNMCNSFSDKENWHSIYYPEYIDLLYQQRAPVGGRVDGVSSLAESIRAQAGEEGIFADTVRCQGVWQQLPLPSTLSLTTCTRLHRPCVGALLTLLRLRCLTPACLFPTFVQMPVLFGLADSLARNYSGRDAERWPRVLFLNSPNDSKVHQVWEPALYLADPAAQPLSHRRRKPAQF